MNDAQNYPIGTPGEKWGEAEKAAWLAEQTIKRSYEYKTFKHYISNNPEVLNGYS